MSTIICDGCQNSFPTEERTDVGRCEFELVFPNPAYTVGEVATVCPACWSRIEAALEAQAGGADAPS